MRASSFPKTTKASLRYLPSCWDRPRKKSFGRIPSGRGPFQVCRPIGLRFNTFFQVVGKNRNNFNLQPPPGQFGPFIPGPTFSRDFFSIFMAGNFGSDIAFWVDDDISVGGSGASGGFGDGYLKFVNI